MKTAFPKYNYEDMVDAQYRLVKEGLGIKHLRLVIGNSMGGMHTWIWGVKYPQAMDALAPMAAQPTEMASRNWMLRRMMLETIRKIVEDRMRRVALPACCCALASAALAFDNGQYEKVPPDIRAWFRSVIAPNGMPCCDISDAHRTQYDFREGAYWVPIEGQRMRVPADAV